MQSPKDKLIDLLSKDKVIPVVGAGVSMASAGLPGWKKLIELGLDYAKNRNLDKDNLIPETIKLLEQDELLEGAKLLKELLNAPKPPFSNWLKEVFDVEIKDNSLINSIYDLCPPLILTTNYDNLLLKVSTFENMSKFDWTEYELANKAIQNQEKFILHLHGVFEKPYTVILSEDDYESINQNQGYKFLLGKLWSEYHFLFIGCSKDGVMDDDFSTVINFLNEWFPDSTHQHFILMDQDKIDAFKHVDLLTTCNIEAISFGYGNSKIPEFIDFINPNKEKKKAKLLAIREQVDLNLSRLDKVSDEDKQEYITTIVSDIKKEEDWINSIKFDIFEKALKGYSDKINDKKKELTIRIDFIKAFISIDELEDKINLWPSIVEATFQEQLDFIKMSLIAFKYLTQIPANILFDLRLKPPYLTQIHERFFDGGIRTEINMFERNKDYVINNKVLNTERFDGYFFENLKRGMTSLVGLLSLNIDELYPDNQVFHSEVNLPEKALVITRNKEITFHDLENLNKTYLTIPTNGLFDFKIISRNGKILVFARNKSVVYFIPELAGNDIKFLLLDFSNNKELINEYTVEKQNDDLIVKIYFDKYVRIYKNLEFFEKKELLMKKNQRICLINTSIYYLLDESRGTVFWGRNDLKYTFLSIYNEQQEKIFSLCNQDIWQLISKTLKIDFNDNSALSRENWEWTYSDYFILKIQGKDCLVLKITVYIVEEFSILIFIDIENTNIIKCIDCQGVVSKVDSFRTNKSDNLLINYYDFGKSRRLNILSQYITNFNTENEVIKTAYKDIETAKLSTLDVYNSIFINENKAILNVEGRLIYILDLASMQYEVYEFSDLGIEKDGRIGNIIYFDQNAQ